MKKGFIVLCLFVANSFANEGKNLLEWNPFDLPFTRGLNLNYERIIGNKNSLGLNPIYEGIGMPNEWHARINMTFSHYSKNDYKGFVYSPRLSLFYAELKTRTKIAKETTLSPSFGFAYRWRFENGITFCIGMGAGPVIEIHRDPELRKDKLYIFDLESIGFVF